MSPKFSRLDKGLDLWPGWNLSTVCEHRLKLFRQFYFLKDSQGVACFPSMIVADRWGKWSDPIHERFLAEAEKVPNRFLPMIVRVNREIRHHGYPAAPKSAACG